jgi:hypothetical protein
MHLDGRWEFPALIGLTSDDGHADQLLWSRDSKWLEHSMGVNTRHITAIIEKRSSINEFRNGLRNL